MWTFEMRWANGPNEWQMSAKRVLSMKEAAQLAADWMVTCLENGQTVETRLVDTLQKHGENK
jgi:hypothetical protein